MDENGLERTYDMLNALELLCDKYKKTKSQSEIPGLTSEDRIGMMMELDALAKKMVESVLAWKSL